MNKTGMIERYRPADRINHWLTAITFLLMAFSGLALFHPSLFFLTHLFGGGTWTRILHPFIGLVMFVSFLVLAMRFWHHNLMHANDWQWLKQWRDVVGNREDQTGSRAIVTGDGEIAAGVFIRAAALALD